MVDFLAGEEKETSGTEIGHGNPEDLLLQTLKSVPFVCLFGTGLLEAGIWGRLVAERWTFLLNSLFPQ